MDADDGDMIRYGSLVRRAALFGGGGVATFIFTIGYLANAARYWTLHPELVAGAGYVASAILIFLSITSWLKARAVRARAMTDPH